MKKTKTGIFYSRGYNANCGFYEKLKHIEEEKDYEGECWITFPVEIVKRLSRETQMSVNWKLRLKYLFSPNFISINHSFSLFSYLNYAIFTPLNQFL